MADNTNSQRTSAAFAINRSFQPTRIERELLAQVFELAVHGPPRECHGGVDDRQVRGQVSPTSLEDDPATQRVSDQEHARDDKRECVA